MKPIYFTQKGFEKVTNEREVIDAKRKEAVSALTTARELGDLSENNAYKAAKWKLSGIDSRIRYLDNLLRFGRIKEKMTDMVDIGTQVTLLSPEGKITYEIVGIHEVDSMEGSISHASPLGKSLLGKKIGDEVKVQTPLGIIAYKIIEVV